MKTEYSKEEIQKLSEQELEALMSEPGWVIKGDKIVKVSDEEYALAQEHWKKRGTGAIDGESL